MMKDVGVMVWFVWVGTPVTGAARGSSCPGHHPAWGVWLSWAASSEAACTTKPLAYEDRSRGGFHVPQTVHLGTSAIITPSSEKFLPLSV